MPQWAGSCWYYLGYVQPRNAERLIDPAAERYWLPVDLYVGARPAPRQPSPMLPGLSWPPRIGCERVDAAESCVMTAACGAWKAALHP
jgi:hypothetical protein